MVCFGPFPVAFVTENRREEGFREREREGEGEGEEILNADKGSE